MLFERMWRGMRLQTSVYEELEHDEKAMNQAAVVVLLIGLAYAISDLVSAVAGGEQIWPALVSTALLQATPLVLIFWLLDASIFYFVGTRVFRGHASLGVLLRTTAFAGSPALLMAVYLPLSAIWLREDANAPFLVELPL